MKRVKKSVPLKKGEKLVLELTACDLSIKGKEEEGLELTIIKRREESLEPVIEQSPGIVKIETQRLRALSPFKEDFDLEIGLPKGTHLEIITASGDLTLTDWEGELAFRSSSGDIEMLRFSGKAQVKTVSGDFHSEEVNSELNCETISGDVRISGGKGKVKISTVSGDIQVTRLEGDLQASTTSGDQSWELIACSTCKLSTVSGDLWGSLHPIKGGNYSLSTTSGDLSLRVPPEAKLEVRIATLSGSIKSDLPLLREEAFEEPLKAEGSDFPWLFKGWVKVGRKLRGILNQPEGLLELKTISGDISLRSL